MSRGVRTNEEDVRHPGREIGVLLRLWSVVLAAVLATRAFLRRKTGRLSVPPGPPPRPSPYPKVLVVGCPRSGTTWVRDLLDAHPRVVSAPESHAYRHVYERVTRGGRNRVVRWAAVLAKDSERRRRGVVGMQVFTNRATFRSLVTEALAHPEWSDAEKAEWLIWAAIEDHVSRSGQGPTDVFVEKTPDHLDHAPHVLDRFPEARVVHVVRDGRDVCVSMQMLRTRVQWPPEKREDQIRRWVEAIEKGRALAEDPRYADRVLEVRYEDLRRDPEAGAARLYEFVGLDNTPARVEAAVEAASFGSRGRPTGVGEYARKGTVGDWREHFDEEDTRIVNAVAGPLLEHLGYPT